MYEETNTAAGTFDTVGAFGKIVDGLPVYASPSTADENSAPRAVSFP